MIRFKPLQYPRKERIPLIDRILRDRNTISCAYEAALGDPARGGYGRRQAQVLLNTQHLEGLQDLLSIEYGSDYRDDGEVVLL